MMDGSHNELPFPRWWVKTGLCISFRCINKISYLSASSVIFNHISFIKYATTFVHTKSISKMTVQQREYLWHKWLSPFFVHSLAQTLHVLKSPFYPKLHSLFGTSKCSKYIITRKHQNALDSILFIAAHRIISEGNRVSGSVHSFSPLNIQRKHTHPLTLYSLEMPKCNPTNYFQKFNTNWNILPFKFKYFISDCYLSFYFVFLHEALPYLQLTSAARPPAVALPHFHSSSHVAVLPSDWLAMWYWFGCISFLPF